MAIVGGAGSWRRVSVAVAVSAIALWASALAEATTTGLRARDGVQRGTMETAVAFAARTTVTVQLDVTLARPARLSVSAAICSTRTGACAGRVARTTALPTPAGKRRRNARFVLPKGSRAIITVSGPSGRELARAVHRAAPGSGSGALECTPVA
jgi:hypothetical protein